MRIYYFDASAFAKHYLREPGNRWVDETLNRAAQDRFVSSELTGVEVICAIARAEREKRIGLALRNSLAARAIEETRNTLRLTRVSRQILSQASQLALRHALRAYDAIHLATALQILSEALPSGLPAPIFVSADENLLAAARAEGLAAENPNAHE